MKKGTFAILRYTSISLDFGIGLIQPFFYSRLLDKTSFSFLAILTGIVLYFSFIDASISRPLYARLREYFVKKHPEVQNILSFSLLFYTLFLVIMTVVIVTVGLTLKHFSNNPLSLPLLLSWCVFMSSTIVCGYIRAIFYALDLNVYFEKAEIVRKLILITLLGLLMFNISFFWVFIASTVLNCIYIAHLFLGVKRSFKLNIKDASKNFVSQLRGFKGGAVDIVIFNLAETFIYNYGYILLPLFYLEEEVISYSLWMRVFVGVSVFMRAITDIFLPAITSHFYTGRADALRSVLAKALACSVVFSIIMSVVFFATKDWILELWVSKLYQIDNFLATILLLFLIANAINHVSSTFLQSLGTHFKTLRNYCVLMAVLILGSSLLVGSLQVSYHYVLLFSVIIYLFGSLLYLQKLHRVSTSRQ